MRASAFRSRACPGNDCGTRDSNPPILIALILLGQVSGLFAAEPAKPPLSERTRKLFQGIKETPSPAPFQAASAVSLGPVPAFVAVANPIPGPAITGKTLHVFRFGNGPEGVSPIVQPSAGAESGEGGVISILADSDHLYLLDIPGRKILGAETDSAETRLLAKDSMGSLSVGDFAGSADGTMVWSDPQRQAIHLFRDHNWTRTIWSVDDRKLFREIQYLFSDPRSGSFGVYDSGRDRTFLFNSRGDLAGEFTGEGEPAFFRGHCVRLLIDDDQLTAELLGKDGSGAGKICSYKPSPGNILLDAWVAGSRENTLVITIAEGKGDEDHPDDTKILILREGKATVRAVPFSSDMELLPCRPYTLLGPEGGLVLVEAEAAPEGIAFQGYPLE